MLKFQHSRKSHLGVLYDVNSNPCLYSNPHDIVNLMTVAALGHSPQSLCDELLEAARASQSCYCKAEHEPKKWVLLTKATDFCLMDNKKTALSVSSDSFYGSSEDTAKPITSSLPEKAVWLLLFIFMVLSPTLQIPKFEVREITPGGSLLEYNVSKFVQTGYKILKGANCTSWDFANVQHQFYNSASKGTGKAAPLEPRVCNGLILQ